MLTGLLCSSSQHQAVSLCYLIRILRMTHSSAGRAFKPFGLLQVGLFLWEQRRIEGEQERTTRPGILGGGLARHRSRCAEFRR